MPLRPNRVALVLLLLTCCGKSRNLAAERVAEVTASETAGAARGEAPREALSDASDDPERAGEQRSPGKQHAARGGQPTARGGAAPSQCAAAGDLAELIECINRHAPGREYFEDGVHQYQAPPQNVRSAWQTVVERLLEQSFEGRCPSAAALPAELETHRLFEFPSTGTGPRYCVLMEVKDADADGIVDRGWGTLITNPNAERELSIQIAHPKFDAGTRAQGAVVFEGVKARSFLLAGTHRHASLSCSADQPDECAAGEKIAARPGVPISTRYLETDVAHDTASLFQAATERIHDLYRPERPRLAEARLGSYAVLQFHGKGRSSCPELDVYLSYGVKPGSARAPSGALQRLSVHLKHAQPSWRVGSAGSGRCDLDGADNVQGRLLNGVPAAAVARTPAQLPSERFVHIEQAEGEFREGARWLEALRATWPVP